MDQQWCCQMNFATVHHLSENIHMNVFYLLLQYFNKEISGKKGQWTQSRLSKRRNITQQLLRIPSGRSEASWLFTSAAEKLNQGLPETNSTSGQNVSWTWDPLNVIMSHLSPINDNTVIIVIFGEINFTLAYPTHHHHHHHHHHHQHECSAVLNLNIGSII